MCIGHGSVSVRVAACLLLGVLFTPLGDSLRRRLQQSLARLVASWTGAATTRPPPADTAAPQRLFEQAFFINADGSTERRTFMEKQLQESGIPYERWPAVLGSPHLSESHASYFSRGVERHLRENHSFTGPIIGWGTVATYLSHQTLFEHIVQRWAHDENAAFLILQDDTKLNAGWLPRLNDLMSQLEPQWERVLLVWWGLRRKRDCSGHFCAVRPPAGPTEAGPECCGKRFYHGLQAWAVRQRNLRCLLRRLEGRKIKNIDALLVQCNCPHSFALQPKDMIGVHLDRELGSERAALNAVWRSRLTNRSLKRAARRNIRKVRLTGA